MSPERRQMDGVAAALSELLGGLWTCFVRRLGALRCSLTGGWWGRLGTGAGGGGWVVGLSVHHKGGNRRLCLPVRVCS